MRITTKQFYQSGIDNILRNQAAVNKTQTQIASGKRVTVPSDDPIGASQMILLRERISRSDSYMLNARSAKASLETQETSLNAAVNLLQRTRELLLQSNNSTLNSADRATISTELQSKLDELVGIANTTDGRGDFVFSGFKTKTAPFILDVNNQYRYQGDSGTRMSEIASGISVATSCSGFDLFENIRAGDGRVMISDTGASNLGTGVIDNFGVSNSQQYVPDTYTLAFVTNGDGQLGYQVSGAASGQVIPALPAVSPTDAPAFVLGSSVTFNGVTVKMSGQPSVGDQFAIAPSQGQSVFTTLQSIITSMGSNIQTDAERAHCQTQFAQALSSLDMALDTVSDARTKIGSRYNAIEDANTINEDCKLSAQSFLSMIEDLDYAQAITELDKQTLSLQAAQQSFLRIQNLSLFAML